MEDILGTTAKRAHPNSSDSTQADKKKKPAPAVELKVIKTSLKSICLDTETIINTKEDRRELYKKTKIPIRVKTNISHGKMQISSS